MFDIRIGDINGFIHVKHKVSDISYTLEAPAFEVNGNVVLCYPLSLAHILSEKNLDNGGREVKINCSIEQYQELQLTIYLQYFDSSPFIRFKYELSSTTAVALTKIKGKDNIRYTGFTTDFTHSRVTELQFSQFDSTVHSYVPDFSKKTTGELINGCRFPGPIMLMEGRDQSLLFAYEHGAEYPDAYLMFHSLLKCGNLNVQIQAEKGNYYNNEIVGPKQPFISPWFHFAFCLGDREMLLRHYRTFLLKHICQHEASRKPYIYYNTWNYQERNKCFNGKKYLDSMNLEHIIKEIHIAHEMGVDIFVIDTGWFINSGDWLVNPDRFPDGLVKVKEKLDQFGMKLGLWFNPMIAAEASETYKNNIDYRLAQNGKGVGNLVWEIETYYYMCLASDYSDIFIKKMVQLYKELGVTYFKWDGISQYGCDSPYHNHGNDANTKEERTECYSYKMGMAMIRIVEEVTRQCPEVIVDFDVTEGGRFVGLGFLSVGKYFLVNNGPYAKDFDLPEKFDAATNEVAVNLSPYTNIFFFPGPARSRFCRQNTKYDFFAPSILFLTHFLPDAPVLSQNNSLSSLMLGGNGIWGDLLSLQKEDIELFNKTLVRYKKVADCVTESYPIVKGFIGSSPEIYEKINHEKSKGIVCFFTRARGTYTYITDKLNPDLIPEIYGADNYEYTPDGRLTITVILEEDCARTVFLM